MNNDFLELSLLTNVIGVDCWIVETLGYALGSALRMEADADVEDQYDKERGSNCKASICNCIGPFYHPVFQTSFTVTMRPTICNVTELVEVIVGWI